MLLTLRAGVACRSNMGTTFRWVKAGVGAPCRGSRLQLAGPLQGHHPVHVLAVSPAPEALALASVLLRIGCEVDVVDLGPADLLQLEAGAEVGGHGREEVVGGVLADRDLDHAGVALKRLEGQLDPTFGLDAATGCRCS